MRMLCPILTDVIIFMRFCTKISTRTAAHKISPFIQFQIIFRPSAFCSRCCDPTTSSTRHCSSMAEFARQIFSVEVTQQKLPEYHCLVFIHHHFCASMYTSSLLLYSNCELDTRMYHKKWCSTMVPIHSSEGCSACAHAKNVTSLFLHKQISVSFHEPAGHHVTFGLR